MWFKEQQGASVHIATVGEQSVESVMRKALAIGADEAIRVDSHPHDGFFVSKQLEAIIKEGAYDLVLCGRESTDYNGGMVPGYKPYLTGYNFINTCVGLTVEGDKAVGIRETDSGRETMEASLPLIIGGQKGLVEESDFKDTQHARNHDGAKKGTKGSKSIFRHSNHRGHLLRKTCTKRRGKLLAKTTWTN